MTLQEIKQVKNGDFLTSKFGDILLVAKVEVVEEGKREVRVYTYFYWCASDKMLMMNEWLYGFYGPGFSEDFYRMSTDEEKKLLTDKMRERGYEWNDRYFIGQPTLTNKEFARIHDCDGYNEIKKVLSLSFMQFLDMNRPEGKMCLSNGECADIDKAFDERDWEKLGRYVNKYSRNNTNKNK